MKKYRVSYSTGNEFAFTDCEYHDTLADAIWAYWSHSRQGRGASIFVWDDDKSEHVEMDCVEQARIRGMLWKGMDSESVAEAIGR